MSIQNSLSFNKSTIKKIAIKFNEFEEIEVKLIVKICKFYKNVIKPKQG